MLSMCYTYISMDNIIQFPTHLIEKERELALREIDLQIQSHNLKISQAAMRSKELKHRARSIMWFYIGVMAGLAVVAGLSFRYLYVP